MEDDYLPAEGAVVIEGRPAGRVTSAPQRGGGAVIGLAWVPDRAESGTRVEIRIDRLLRGAR